MANKTIVKIVKKNNFIYIYISTLLHLVFKTDTYIGFQSWIDEDYYIIEHYFNNGTTIKSKYDTKDKWQAILKELDLIFIE
jgi:hypothetical protein